MIVTVNTPSAVVTRTTAPPKMSNEADRSAREQRDDGGDTEGRRRERHQHGGVAGEPAPQADGRLGADDDPEDDDGHRRSSIELATLKPP
jgi:hypothetical protein